jgi:tRNA-dihydrouridine synthase B
LVTLSFWRQTEGRTEGPPREDEPETAHASCVRPKLIIDWPEHTCTKNRLHGERLPRACGFLYTVSVSSPASTGRKGFRIGSVAVPGDLLLAPMSGFSDLPFRSLCRGFGSAASYTEFVSAKEIASGRGGHWRKALTFLPWERPVIMQLFDADEHRLLEAALTVAELQPDVIDVNLGCSVPKIANRGAGAALLRDPAKVGRIFNRLAAALPCPVSAKIRLGWDHRQRNYCEVVHALQENGAAMIAVHARTRDQGYSGVADWDAIRRIVDQAKVPVIGNGDVSTVSDVARMKASTGCAAVMVGRGAIGNPWLFQGRDRSAVPAAEKSQVIRYHYLLMEDFYGPDRAILLIRKHLTKYFNEQPGVREIRPRLARLSSKQMLYHLLDSLES